MNDKIYLVLLLLLIFVLDNYTSLFEFARQAGYRVSPYLFPFCFTHPFMRIVIFSSVIFLFSDAPFISDFQLLLLSRTGKRKWYLAQMLYLGICCFLFTAFLAVLPVIKNITMIAFVKDWGKVIETLADGHYNFIHPVSYDMVSRYSAWQVMGYTVCISILLMLLLGMILYLCNISFKNRSIGILISAALVLLDWFIYLTGNNRLLWISPVSWTQISNMAYARERGIPSVGFSLVCLIVSDVVLLLSVYFVSQRKDVVEVTNR
ncbi:MAG: hypothetical protein J6C32_10870 [Eubacterium sp.]|nr:hypothetical protein [Eubacterium sp.]